VNNLPSQGRRDALRQELLEYWIHNPDALGTEESIAEWWLLEQRIHQAVGEVRSILTEFVALEFVVKRQQADGRISYRLNSAKEAEIRAWLAARQREK
jgi:hypothetical protein